MILTPKKGKSLPSSHLEETTLTQILPLPVTHPCLDLHPLFAQKIQNTKGGREAERNLIVIPERVSAHGSVAVGWQYNRPRKEILCAIILNRASTSTAD